MVKKFKNAGYKNPDEGSTLGVEFNLLGVAVFIEWDKTMGVGCVLSPIDAREVAAEILRLADESETYGTAANPIRMPPTMRPSQ